MIEPALDSDEQGVAFQRVMVSPLGLLARRAAAEMVGVKSKTLAEWHRLGKGPKSRLVGGRRFYHIDDLRAFASGGSH